jgi:hypothetical protein
MIRVILVVLGVRRCGHRISKESGSGGKEALTVRRGHLATEIRIGDRRHGEPARRLFQGSVDAVKRGEVDERGERRLADARSSSTSTTRAPTQMSATHHRGLSKDSLRRHPAIFVFNADDLVGCKAPGRDRRARLPGLTTETAHQCSPVSFPINPPILQCDTAKQNPQTYSGVAQRHQLPARCPEEGAARSVRTRRI